ncbi:hypothetical protein AWB80_06191 [Caballeronia pedi]|uniref:Uncharacterized protein n=1 Tax=Caballeronia pedi TaxID=1777141 RepID=A0A158D2L0_9BURK|nr:hypothetical protein [Caballeronia pedi]SAK88818.1 hypothetical protein AWB80_06191 [Caballeronia pedi]
MNQYFTTRQGAIRRLIEIKREMMGAGYPLATVVGRRKDGCEINGVESVLVSVRAGRIACFFHTSATENRVVFIS